MVPTDDPIVDESKETPLVDEGSTEEVGEDSVETLRTALAQERASREKTEKDLSSLRGQVRSQTDRDTAFQDEMAGLNKRLDLMVGHMLHPDDGEKTEAALAQAQTDQMMASQTRQLERVMQETKAEVADAITDADGKPLFEAVHDAPELESARAFWQAGATGVSNGKPLTFSERLAALNRSAAEASKAARIAERSKAQDQRSEEKKQKALDVKQKSKEDGELDLDDGPGAASHGKDLSTMSPLQLIESGLSKGKNKSKVFQRE